MAGRHIQRHHNHTINNAGATPAVQQLRAAIEEYRWEGGGRIGVIAAVDCGLGEEEKNSCREIADTHRYVFMDDGTLKNALEKMGCEIP